MRTLKLHVPNDALPTLDTFVKQTRETRVFRRAQAVREVVKGHRLQTVSDTLSFTYSALRKWSRTYSLRIMIRDLSHTAWVGGISQSYTLPTSFQSPCPPLCLSL